MSDITPGGSGFNSQTKRVGKHRSRLFLNDSSLVLAFLATAFAGWSGYEAHQSRLFTHQDMMDTVKLANRSYVYVSTPQIAAKTFVKLNPLSLKMTTEAPQPLIARATIKVFGPDPVFEVSATIDCQVGRIGILTNKPGGIVESDVKSGTPMLAAGTLPAIMVPNQEYVIPAGCRFPFRDPAIGAIEYGFVHYKDAFGGAHYAHFCYQNPFLIPAALADPDPQKWKRSAIDAGKATGELAAGNLTPCQVFNDSDPPKIR